MIMHSFTAFVVSVTLSYGVLLPRSFGADSHETRVANIVSGLNARRDSLIQSLDELEISFHAYNLPTQTISEARQHLAAMLNSKAWRDLNSRSTKTQKVAISVLDRFLHSAYEKYSDSRRELAIVKKAEFEVWARANPEAAKIIELQRRVQSAESTAFSAQQDANRAREAASSAQSEAQNAQWLAREAEKRSREASQRANDAERKSERAEDSLRSHGLHSW